MSNSPVESQRPVSDAASPESAVEAVVLARVAEEIFRSLPLAVIVFDRALRIAHRNEPATTLFPAENDIARLLTTGTVEGKYQDWASELRRVMESGTAQRFESVGFAYDRDEPRLLDMVCMPLRGGESSRAVGAMLVCEDHTQRAGLERRLAVSERMAAVGRLAARVAHELNNPLDGVLRYVNMTLRILEPDGPEKAVSFLKESRTGLMRMAEIVSELLKFSRSSEAQLEETNVNDAADEAMRTFQDQAARQGVVCAAAFHDRDMPRIRGAKLFQVCCNLVKNALDAMPDGGTLTVTTALVEREVVLKFEDTGCGLPDDVDTLFEPFYTTKATGKGTGLGLAICKDYVARLGGSITAGNRPEGGAVFTVRIPLDNCEGR